MKEGWSIYLQAPVVKEKSKVEDGIFGTSGGIGFTKQNELFVGRVAMIGFAVSLRHLRICFIIFFTVKFYFFINFYDHKSKKIKLKCDQTDSLYYFFH